MELEREVKDRKRKSLIRAIFIIFAAGLVMLTLFSNTLKSSTLPKVQTESLIIGSLPLTLERSSSLEPVSQEKLFNSVGWEVKEILVKQGDRVKKGQELVRYDSTTAEGELADQGDLLKKQEIEMKRTQEQYVASVVAGEDKAIREAERIIEIGKLDRQLQERKMNGLQDSIRRGQVLLAPFDGIVAEVGAALGLPSSEGDVVLTNDARGFQFRMNIDAALLSQMEITKGADLDFEVILESGTAKGMKGSVSNVLNGESGFGGGAGPESEADSGTAPAAASEPRKIVIVQVADPELKGGEQVHVKLDKRSGEPGMLVSSKAVHQDRSGTYVFKVEERRGALGNIFVARKVAVHLILSTERECLVEAENLYEKERIVLESGEPLQDGDRVRLD